jgi:methionyl-tRNA synthetase
LKSYYVTTPIYYVNDVPHIGHAYTTIAADVMARFKRWTKNEVFFLTGTDEHGQKVEKAAKEKGRTPKALADEMVKRFQELWKRLDITNDHFVRTTDDYHAKVVQKFFARLLESGDIYLGEYEGWYCTPCETYWLEDELRDENTCPDCGRPTERLKEPSYFFRLSKYQEPLLKFYKENPDFVRPQTRMNEIVSFVSGGLNDISISRTNFSWGIPVPGDPKHVIYVWFDALFNYLSGLGYGWKDERYHKFWPADVHFIGKDILRFHAVFWPAFLMAAGVPLPKRVFAHGWWTVEGRKMSKSLRNVVDPHLLIDLYGGDALRYFLLREVSFGFDGDFSHRAMAHRVNGDLANDLGNLFYRSLSMEIKYFKGDIPQPTGKDREISSLAEAVVKDVVELMEMQEFKKALNAFGIWLRP